MTHFEQIRIMLDTIGCPWWICGSLALKLHGLNRHIHDIDMCFVLDDVKPIRQFLINRGWFSQWSYDDMGNLLCVHVMPAPRQRIDLFLKDEVVPTVVIDGLAVQSLDECLLSAKLFFANEVHFEKWEKDIFEIKRILEG